MYYLYSWLLDYFDSKKTKNFNITKIIEKLSFNVAEIESLKPIKYDLNNFTLVEVVSISPEDIMVKSYEYEKIYILPYRENIREHDCYIIANRNNSWEWATVRDFYGDKDSLLPNFSVDEESLNGSWKNDFLKDDFIIKIDNKSIGNRPDLWSHYGLARELAFHLDLNLLSDEIIFGKNEAINLKNAEKSKKDIIKLSENEFKFVAFSKINNIYESPSHLFYGLRLAAINIKPISYIVDLTNYVSADIGNPMHAYDANFIKGSLEFKKAENIKNINLLDGSMVELNENDLIAKDDESALGIVGIMGGMDSKIKIDTNSILVESLVCDSRSIKDTTKRINLRTDSSIKFEKEQSPNCALKTIKRFLKLLKIEKPEVFYIGEFDEKIDFIVSHHKIESLIGNDLDIDLINKIGNGLGFSISTIETENGISYRVQAPWWRKDIKIEEDFIEEVARSVGYNNINITPAKMLAKNSIIGNDLVSKLDLIDRIKNWSTDILRADEIISHGILNEQDSLYLNDENDNNLVHLRNGYTENQYRMLPTLALPLIRKVIDKSKLDGSLKEIKIFEVGRVWKKNLKGAIIEKVSYSFVWYDSTVEKFDFYKKKAYVESLLKKLGIENFNFEKNILNNSFIKFSNIFSEINIKEKKIGEAGFIEQASIYDLVKTKAAIFVCEIDIDEILENILEIKDNKIKIKNDYFDISFLCKKDFIVSADLINKIDFENIKNIEIIDWFEKDDWIDKRSVTIRVFINEKNIEKNFLYENICKVIKENNCSIR